MTLRLKAGNKFGATEKQEQAAIVKLLRSIGASVYVLGTVRRKGDHPGTMQTPGLPDLYVVLPHPIGTIWSSRGLPVVWIEVKADKGQLRPEQRKFRSECLRTTIAHVTGGVDAVVKFLQAGGWLK